MLTLWFAMLQTQGRERLMWTSPPYSADGGLQPCWCKHAIRSCMHALHRSVDVTSQEEPGACPLMRALTSLSS